MIKINTISTPYYCKKTIKVIRKEYAVHPLISLAFTHREDDDEAAGHALANGRGLGERGLGRTAHGTGSGAGPSLLLKHLPKLETLIGSGGRNHLSVGRHAAVQDAALVGRNLDILDERRVAPDAERVVREARAADEFLVRGAPAQRGDLAGRVDRVDAGARGRVPKVRRVLHPPWDVRIAS